MKTRFELLSTSYAYHLILFNVLISNLQSLYSQTKIQEIEKECGVKHFTHMLDDVIEFKANYFHQYLLGEFPNEVGVKWDEMLENNPYLMAFITDKNPEIDSKVDFEWICSTYFTTTGNIQDSVRQIDAYLESLV